jgi:Acyl-protein synthetase, LuxE
MTFEDFLALPPFSLAQSSKEPPLLAALNELTAAHRRNCPEYDRLLEVMHPGYAQADTAAGLPFLPVSLFKHRELRSIPSDQVFKTLTSSGTTGQQVSRIVLDRVTAQRQTAALSRIMTHVLGPQRLPMLLIETKDVIANRREFSARGAGLLGMMNFGRNHTYALNGDMSLNVDAVREFLAAYGGKPFAIFGFTFMVWKYFFLAAESLGLDLSQGILIHSGGWKKLIEMAVPAPEFRARFQKATGLTRIYNFYGMVEQVGSIFLEGEDGYLYAPNFADIIIRDPVTWKEAPVGTPGVVQVLSILPLSYPGHSLLTEDLGVIHGIDDSCCGRKGKYFSILGRIPKAELRGCSDTHAATAVGV